MAMMVADTDVLIDFLNGKSPAADRVALELGVGLKTTVITRFELLSGARGRQAMLVKELLDAIGVLSLGCEEADRAAEVRRELEQTGVSIGMADSLIAGIVLSHGAMLLTRNRKHFERVNGLKLGSLE
jgi:tRNA(fMet)-specific endonuclease VapC